MTRGRSHQVSWKVLDNDPTQKMTITTPGFDISVVTSGGRRDIDNPPPTYFQVPEGKEETQNLVYMRRQYYVCGSEIVLIRGTLSFFHIYPWSDSGNEDYSNTKIPNTNTEYQLYNFNSLVFVLKIALSDSEKAGVLSAHH